MIFLHLIGMLGVTIVLYQCCTDGSFFAAFYGASLMAVALLGLDCVERDPW